MAHPNIAKRRIAVADLLERCIAITPAMRKELAQHFGCSATAIAADIIALQRTQRVRGGKGKEGE